MILFVLMRDDTCSVHMPDILLNDFTQLGQASTDLFRFGLVLEPCGFEDSFGDVVGVYQGLQNGTKIDQVEGQFGNVVRSGGIGMGYTNVSEQQKKNTILVEVLKTKT